MDQASEIMELRRGRTEAETQKLQMERMDILRAPDDGLGIAGE